MRSTHHVSAFSSLLGLTGLLAAAAPAVAGFEGAYELQHWSSTGIDEGETSIDPGSGPADEATFSYTVDLGNPGGGVTLRTTTFTTIAMADGTVTLDWNFEGFHAFFDAEAVLQLYAETSDGPTFIELVNGPAGGGFAFSGRGATLEIEAGQPWGIIVGGSNFDTNSVLEGAVTISGLSAPQPHLDGAYEMERWSTSGIDEGETSITPDEGSAALAEFGYAVDLGNPGPGVTFRTATYSATAPESGTVTFDWSYEGFHAFFDAEAVLQLYAETSDGTTVVELFNGPAGGGFALSGQAATIEVERGMPFGIIAGGANFDSNSTIEGAVRVWNWTGPQPLFRGAYELQHWMSSGIEEGETAIDPESGASDEADFSYDVSLGNPGPGVTFRTATFSTDAVASGTISLDWSYEGFHAFFDAVAVLQIFVETEAGTDVIDLVNGPAGGGFAFSGENIVIDVEQGRAFGFIVGGANFDSNSTIEGVLAVEATELLDGADLDGDGDVDGADLGLLLGAWGSNDADLNGDGVTDGADLGILLGSWG